MSLAESVRVKGTGWTVYFRVLDGMTECDSTEEPRGRHCMTRQTRITGGDHSKGGVGQSKVRSRNSLRPRRTRLPTRLGERTTRTLTRGRSKKPENQGRWLRYGGWCREANETDRTLEWISVCRRLDLACPVVRIRFDSIRLVCLYWGLVQVLGWACGGGITKTNSRSRL